MSIKYRMKPTLVASLLLLSTLISQSAFALSIPGLYPSGTVGFLNEVKVRYTVKGQDKSTLTITGKKGFTFFNGGVYAGTDSMYNLKAEFTGTTLTGGDVSLKGAIPSIGIVDKNTVLFTADLDSFGFDLAQPMLIGFNTTNIVCDVGLGVPCTTSESVYIELDALWPGLNTSNFRTTGLATTTIPLPAAVWLFGSGLAILGATARRRRARGC